MRKKLNLEKDGMGNEVELFISKLRSIENMSEVIELELIGKNGTKKKLRYDRKDINKKEISKLKDYGVDLDNQGWRVAKLVEQMENEADKLEYNNYHENIGWLNTEKGLSFRSKNLIGSSVKSELLREKCALSKNGCLEEWIKGVDKYIVGDRYLEILLVAGFSSIFTTLINKDKEIKTGSLVFNVFGGLNWERDVIIELINSIWCKVEVREGGLINVFDDDEKKLLKAIESNKGMTIVIDDIRTKSSNKLINLINYLQKEDINSTVIVSSEDSVTNFKSNINILKKENVSEIDLNIYEVLKDEVDQFEFMKLIRRNYGLAGTKVVEGILEVGVEKILSDFDQICKSLEKDVYLNRMSYRKINKISLYLLTAKYIKDILNLNLDIGKTKETLLELESDIKGESLLYKNAYKEVVEYFFRNKDKFILKGEDIKKNTIGLFELERSGVIKKITIPTYEFEKIIRKLNYDYDKTLKFWKSNNLIEYDNEKGKDRKNKKVTFGTFNTRCVVIKVKGDF